MNMTVLWLILMVIFALVEAFTTALVSIWFVIGALVSFIISFFTDNALIQIIVFIVVSVLALILTKPLVKKFITPKIEKTNADRVIGKLGVVTQEINNVNATGQVKVAGNTWTARAKNNKIIPKGTEIVALKIEGVKLIVDDDLSKKI